MDLAHIAIRPLNTPDFPAVEQLETLGFPPNERCSTIGLKYRLKICPELCSGLFMREFSEGNAADHEEDGTIVGNGGRIIKETLIGHVLGTKIEGDYITEEAMQVPDEFIIEQGGKIEETTENSKLLKGHVESSTTIGIHSLVIHPLHQKKNLATLLMNDFIQKLSNLSVGDRIVIISKEKLIPFYERLGFILKGKSKCLHGGEEWFDLERVLENEDDEL